MPPLLTAAGLYAPHSKSSANEIVDWLVFTGKISSRILKYTKVPWTWDSMLLKSSRAGNVLVVLAQASAILELVLRRRQVKDATLLLEVAD